MSGEAPIPSMGCQSAPLDLPALHIYGNPNQGKPSFPYTTPCDDSVHTLKKTLTTLKITTSYYFLSTLVCFQT